MNLLIDSYVMDKFFVVIALKIINLKNGLIPKKLYKTKVAFSHGSILQEWTINRPRSRIDNQ
jgi:hypothetical protein